jgi:hypothetical protein
MSRRSEPGVQSARWLLIRELTPDGWVTHRANPARPDWSACGRRDLEGIGQFSYAMPTCRRCHQIDVDYGVNH